MKKSVKKWKKGVQKKKLFDKGCDSNIKTVVDKAYKSINDL